MEALIGDPINTVVDQEAVLLLYHYGFTQLYGASAKYIGNLIDGKSELLRQIVEFEDYQKSVPQLQYAAPEDVPNDQTDLGSGSRPSEADHGRGSSKRTAKVFAPGGMQYDLPESERAPEKPNIDLRPRSERVGASAKSVPQPPAATAPSHGHNRLLPKRCHRQAHQQRGIRLLHLYHQECKPREEGTTRIHLTKGPPVTPHNRHKPQSTLSWTNGEAGGTKNHEIRVVAKGDLRAEIGQEGRTKVGLTIHDNYINEEKIWGPGVA